MQGKAHRIIPARFPPISLFEWAESVEELFALGTLDSLTNERLGDISLVPEEDSMIGPGSSILMAPFTHPGPSRFSDGSFGIYYAADTIETAIAETVYHRERFLSSSQEAASLIQMREYITDIIKPLETLSTQSHPHLLMPDPTAYQPSQTFGSIKKQEKIWGLEYPSVRKQSATCVAIFRPPALSIPIQASLLEYIWDGKKIAEVRESKTFDN